MNYCILMMGDKKHKLPVPEGVSPKAVRNDFLCENREQSLELPGQIFCKLVCHEG